MRSVRPQCRIRQAVVQRMKRRDDVDTWAKPPIVVSSLPTISGETSSIHNSLHTGGVPDEAHGLVRYAASGVPSCLLGLILSRWRGSRPPKRLPQPAFFPIRIPRHSTPAVEEHDFAWGRVVTRPGWLPPRG